MKFPRTSKHDPSFVAENMMGPPNPLKLLEQLSESMNLRPGMRVLDLGCGRGLTSLFLAREFGVQVFAYGSTPRKTLRASGPWGWRTPSSPSSGTQTTCSSPGITLTP